MTVAMHQAISQVQSHLVRKTSTHNSSLLSLLDTAEVYRWIYYIERIRKCSGGKGVTDDRLDRSMRLIEAFDQYEGRLLDGTSNPSRAIEF